MPPTPRPQHATHLSCPLVSLVLSCRALPCCRVLAMRCWQETLWRCWRCWQVAMLARSTVATPAADLTKCCVLFSAVRASSLPRRHDPGWSETYGHLHGRVRPPPCKGQATSMEGSGHLHERVRPPPWKDQATSMLVPAASRHVVVGVLVPGPRAQAVRKE